MSHPPVLPNPRLGPDDSASAIFYGLVDALWLEIWQVHVVLRFRAEENLYPYCTPRDISRNGIGQPRDLERSPQLPHFQLLMLVAPRGIEPRTQGFSGPCA